MLKVRNILAVGDIPPNFQSNSISPGGTTYLSEQLNSIINQKD